MAMWVMVSITPSCSRVIPAGSRTLPGGQSTAYAINDRGDIVGFSEGSNHAARAVVIVNGVMRDLNALIPAGSGWVLTEARDINDSGRIVGTGWRNGEQRGFLLTPS